MTQTKQPPANPARFTKLRGAMNSNFDLFSWMDLDARQELAGFMRPRAYQAGQSIYDQDDDASEMYRIVVGFVRLSVRAEDGSEAVFLFFGPGDFFGATSLVDYNVRPHTAEALTEVRLDVLTLKDFAALRSRQPSFNEALMRLFIEQMRAASLQLVNSQLHGLSARIAKRILELLNVGKRPGDAPASQPLQISQSELAALVGTSRQSANKVLKSFQAAGLIEVHRKMIVVLDLVGLARASTR